jgi:hypothetical protein
MHLLQYVDLIINGWRVVNILYIRGGESYRVKAFKMILEPSPLVITLHEN